MVSVHLAVEPSWVAVGPRHVAAGMNNRAWFYCLETAAATSGATGETTREYIARVAALRLNSEVAAALCEGRLQVHAIDEASREAVVPEDDSDGKVTSHDITSEAIVYGTDVSKFVLYVFNNEIFNLLQGHILNLIFKFQIGVVSLFHLHHWCQVQRYKHTSAIRLVTAEHCGTRVAFLDENHQAFVFSPVSFYITRFHNTLWLKNYNLLYFKCF